MDICKVKYLFPTRQVVSLVAQQISQGNLGTDATYLVPRFASVTLTLISMATGTGRCSVQKNFFELPSDVTRIAIRATLLFSLSGALGQP